MAKKEKSQIKSKKRVAEKGEVFTNEREVNAMLDLVKQETQRIDSRFLEPACGDGNFLIEIIRRKMEVVKKRYKTSQYEFERNSLIAYGSIYGIEIMRDNSQAGRDRLYKFFEKMYKKLYKETWKQGMLDSVKFILEKNIVWANGLTMMTMETDEKESNSPIVFSEWSLFGATLIRRDFEFKDLIKKGKDKVYIPKPIKEYSYENHLGIGEEKLMINKKDLERLLLSKYPLATIMEDSKIVIEKSKFEKGIEFEDFVQIIDLKPEDTHLNLPIFKIRSTNLDALENIRSSIFIDKFKRDKTTRNIVRDEFIYTFLIYSGDFLEVVVDE